MKRLALPVSPSSLLIGTAIAALLTLSTVRNLGRGRVVTVALGGATTQPQPAAIDKAPDTGLTAKSPKTVASAKTTRTMAVPPAARPAPAPVAKPGSAAAKAPKAAVRRDVEQKQKQEQDRLRRRWVTARLVEILRSQVSLYKLQHGDRPPDFVRYPNGEQLCVRTDRNGVIAATAPYGPYLDDFTRNPMNGHRKVAVVAGDVRPGQRIKGADWGWVYCRGSGRIWALDEAGRVFDDAAVAPPPTQHASPAEARAALLGELHRLRAGIALYRLQHNDAPPDLKHYPNWEQLTRRTCVHGLPNAKGRYGPYYPRRPRNPMNGSAGVEVVARLPLGSYTPAGGASVGFVYETESGRVWATDQGGSLMRE